MRSVPFECKIDVCSGRKASVFNQLLLVSTHHLADDQVCLPLELDYINEIRECSVLLRALRSLIRGST